MQRRVVHSIPMRPKTCQSYAWKQAVGLTEINQSVSRSTVKAGARSLERDSGLLAVHFLSKRFEGI